MSPCCCRTVTDVGLGNNPAGLAIAAMSVVSSGMQQIFCRTMQQKHKLSSHELLANTAPAQVEHALRSSCCSTRLLEPVFEHCRAGRYFSLGRFWIAM